jgi:branched-chain amino acid transport system substrate-binding protein
MVKVLQQCGNDLTRANIMRQAANLKDFRPDMLLPGIALNTSPTDFAPMKDMRTARLKGERWEIFGDIMSGSDRVN